MMSLALQTKNGANGAMATVDPPPAQPRGPVASMIYAMNEIWEMAEHVSASGLFATHNPNQAFTLMMLCQSEGLHPIQAIKRFHIIEGRPAMRSDAIQAEFQSRGGLIEILRSDAVEARAIFSHPIHQPKGFEYAVTYKEFEASGMLAGKFGVKDNWKKSPADMLWARLVTKAIRKVFPGVVVGIYSPEEIEDMEALPMPTATVRMASVASLPHAPAAPSEPDIPVMGYDPDSPDQRTYSALVYGAVTAVNTLIAANIPEGASKPEPLGLGYTHGRIFDLAAGKGWTDGEKPKKATEAVKALTPVYAAHRNEVRAELQVVCNEYQVAAAEKLTPKAEEAAVVSREPGEDDDDIDLGGI